MINARTFLLSFLALALTACSQISQEANAPTRLESNPLGFHSTPMVSDGLTEQAAALNAHARGIVRASTLKGAMIGAAVGCGLGMMSAGGASNCAKVAAVGAIGGAVAGNIAGKRDVTRRVELASPNALVRNLRKANKELAVIKETLPTLLARQDAEMNSLSMALAANQINAQTHDQRIAAIRNQRAQLAQTLMMTTQQARLASANLQTAAAGGHTGLEWHISATDQLARETLSARSTISLL